MRKNKLIYCNKCAEEITSKDNLVVINYFFKIAPYHNGCYAEASKNSEAVFTISKSINGAMSNIYAAVSAIFGIILLNIPEISFLSIPFFLYLLLKFYSWSKYERYL